MIDPRILQALESNDPEKRKKAVAYLAKALDRDALPHLARVFKTDKDPQIRELAKKAGAYIQKNAPEPQSESLYEEEEEEDASYSRYNSLYADDDDDQDDDDDHAMSYDSDDADVPLPSNVQVSPVAEERAKSFVEQAMDWNVRGNNAKAVELLKKAFKANPRLLYDSYTMGLAVNITGLSQSDAQRLLMPSEKDLKQMSGARTSDNAPTRQLNAIQQFFVLLIFLGATATLIGFFALPWLDFGWIPIESTPELNQLSDLSALGMDIDANNFGTIGGALGEVQKLFNSAEIREAESQLGVLGSQGVLVRQGLNGLRGIRSNASGMDTMLYMIGSQDILRTFGFGGIIDFLLDALNDPEFLNLALSTITNQLSQLGGDLGGDLGLGQLDANTLRLGINVGLEQLKYSPQAVDFSVIAVPVSGSFGFLLALLLFMAPNGWAWFFSIVFGLAGVGACAYFYTTAIYNLTLLDATGINMVQSLNEVGVNVTSSAQFIGLGFWVSMGGVITVAIAPFLGLLFAPAKQTA